MSLNPPRCENQAIGWSIKCPPTGATATYARPTDTPLAAHNRHYVRRPARPWQCLYLRPDPHGHRSLRPTFVRHRAIWRSRHSLGTDPVLPCGEVHLLVPQSFSAGIEFPLPGIKPGRPLPHLACDLLGEDITRVALVANNGLELVGNEPRHALTHRKANRLAVPPPRRPHRIRDRDLHRLDSSRMSQLGEHPPVDPRQGSSVQCHQHHLNRLTS